MNILSAGEISEGIYVVIYEIVYPRRYQCEMTGRPVEEIVTDRFGWIKGIPFRVINVNGPIVAVDTQGIFATLPRVTFFDSRYHKFMETNKRFHDNYYKIMKQNSSPEYEIIN